MAAQARPPKLTIAYIDCCSGVSGDMLLGALVDAGLPLDALTDELQKLPVSGYHLTVEPRVSHMVSGTKLNVVIDDQTPQPERNLGDIRAMLDASDLSPIVRQTALGVFTRLAIAESRIHQGPIEEVHFHEVGAVDSIVDIVGSMIGLEMLGIQRVYASSLPLGTGYFRAAHGLIPAPAPSTMAVLADVGAPTRPGPRDNCGELVTPTGAAILAEIADFEQPPMRVHRIGHGFGTKLMDWPNMVRLWLGEPTSDLVRDQVTVIESNLDDCTPEVLGYAMERLLAAGALDVYFTPIQMKKNRPGSLLGVICPPGKAAELAEIVLAETTSLGVRMTTADRLITKRRAGVVTTPYGDVRVKVKQIAGREIASPEYDDCARLAREHGVPIAEVYRAATR
jgi:hypothetical protein